MAGRTLRSLPRRSVLSLQVDETFARCLGSDDSTAIERAKDTLVEKNNVDNEQGMQMALDAYP